jgi:hypothetical protein
MNNSNTFTQILEYFIFLFMINQLTLYKI